jgi:RNA polymerase sigma-54 factor
MEAELPGAFRTGATERGKEDKRNPMSDQDLANQLNEKGYKVARRTVSKYREQLNEPVARLRKQI